MSDTKPNPISEEIADVVGFSPAKAKDDTKVPDDKLGEAPEGTKVEPTGEESVAIKGKKDEGAEKPPKGSEPDKEKPKDEEKPKDKDKPKDKEKPEGKEESTDKGSEGAVGGDEKDKLIAQLQKQQATFIETIANLTAASQPKETEGEGESEDEGDEDKEKPKGKPKKTVKTGEPLDIEELNLLPEDSDEFEELLQNPKELNKTLNTLLRKAVEIGRSSMLAEFPTLVERQVTSLTNINQLVQDFYNKNIDLVPVKPYVGVVANQIQTQHPEYPVAKLFEETERVVRESLSIPKKKEAVKSKDKGNEGDDNPKFANPPGSRKPPKLKLEGLAKEIHDLITD